MSPQSRKRKKQPRGGRPHLRVVADDPLDALLAEFWPVLDGSVDEAEAVVSMLLGSSRAELGPGAADELVGDLISHCAATRSAASLGLLRCLAELATEERRRDAADAADELCRTGLGEPDWTGLLGAARCVGAWQLADVWGDQASVLAVFERAGVRHGLFALVDFNQFGGEVLDLMIADDVDDLMSHLRRTAVGSAVTGRLEELAPGVARRLIENGIEATDGSPDSEPGEDYPALRALALARCRAMPGPEPAPDPPQFDTAARDALVGSFLDEASFTLPVPRDAARRCARLIVDYGCDYDAGQPLRVGPVKLATFLLGYLPRRVILDDADREALPSVAEAWVDWAAARTGLPAAGLDAVHKALEIALEDFDDVYDDENTSPVGAALADLDPDTPSEQLQAILDRRMFAMPYFGATIGHDEYDRLDPNDEDELRLLVIGEHPDLHEALADPDYDADAAGFSPELHVTVDTAVVDQLWHDDPPEAWQAAQRLREKGMDRLDAIHEIAAVFVEHVWHALAEDRPIDPAAYPAALDRLGRDTPRGRRR